MKKASSGRNLDSNLEMMPILEMLSLLYSFKLYIRQDPRIDVVSPLLVQALHTPRSKNRSGVYRPKYKKNKKRFSRLSRSPSIRVHVEVPNGYGRTRGVGAAPRRGRSNQAV